MQLVSRSLTHQQNSTQLAKSSGCEFREKGRGLGEKHQCQRFVVFVRSLGF